VEDDVLAVPVRWRAFAAAPAHALRDTAATPAFARTQGAWALICIGTWTYTVAVAVYAFRASGAAGVGLAVVLRTLPSVVAGPAVGKLADRVSRAAVMTGAACASSIALGLSATAAAVGSPMLARADLIRADRAARLPLRELAVLRMVPMHIAAAGLSRHAH